MGMEGLGVQEIAAVPADPFEGFLRPAPYRGLGLSPEEEAQVRMAGARILDRASDSGKRLAEALATLK